MSTSVLWIPPESAFETSNFSCFCARNGFDPRDYDTLHRFTSFLEASLALMARSSHLGSLAFVCMDWRHMSELLAAARAASLEMLNLCVWTKPNAGMGGLYRSQHELVFVIKLGAGCHRNNVQLGRVGRHRSNVWQYANSPGFGREEGRLAELHPTVKPTAIVADAILDVTTPGEIELNVFHRELAFTPLGRVLPLLRRWVPYIRAAAEGETNASATSRSTNSRLRSRGSP